MDKDYMRQTSPHRKVDQNSALEKYMKTYNYKELVRQYDYGDAGVWQIYGEDPNCDLGGSHVRPLLATVEGEFSEVLAYAVALPNFFLWGFGGSINKVEWEQVPKQPHHEPLYLKRGLEYVKLNGFMFNTRTEEVDEYE